MKSHTAEPAKSALKSKRPASPKLRCVDLFCGCGGMSLAERVIELIEAARQKVATVANVAQVYTNYEIGRQIVEEEQGGKRRAEYGKKILIDLSQKLTARFGRGWSVDNLEKMRRFFLLYSQVEISATPLRKFGGNEKSAKGLRKSDEAESSSTICQVPRFTLGWSHYLLLMRIADPVERAFYEREATEQYTSVMPSKLALKRIVIEEKRKFEKEKLLALAAAKQMPVSGRKGSLP